MATIIIRNSTGSGVTPSSLVQGELAINTVDGKLFYGSGSGNIVKEFTGSGGGSAISASYALTASYAANGGVTQLLAGPNISISPTTGVGQVTISSTGGGSSFNTATGSYGSFYSTQTQTNVAGTARSMSLNTTDISNGVSISGSTNPYNTYIKVENAGVYDIQFSAQVDKSDAGADEIWIWLRKNGTNLTETATSIKLTGNADHQVAAWNFFVNANANDYFQLMWYSPDANVRLHAEAGFGVVPGIPSLIVTANRVDQFLSNTGSFSGSFNGSFTGSLFGTASNALTASYLNTLNQDLTFNGNLTLNGTASISTLVVNQTQYSSGSNQLGDAANDTQTLYGSVIIPTGSLTVTGSVRFRGSGSSSATNALTVQNNSGTTLLNTRDDGLVTIGASGWLGVGETSRYLYRALNATGIFTIANDSTIGSSIDMFGSSHATLPNLIRVTAPSGIQITGSLSVSSSIAINTTVSSFNLDTAISTAGGVRFNGALGGNLTYSYAEYIGAYYVAGWSSTGNIGLRSGASQRILISNTDQTAGLTLFGNRLGLANATPSAKLHITGEGSGSATTTLRVENSNGSASLVVLDNGFVGIGATASWGSTTALIEGNIADTRLGVAGSGRQGVFLGQISNVSQIFGYDYTAVTPRFLALNSFGGNVVIGTSTDSGFKLDVNGTSRFVSQSYYGTFSESPSIYSSDTSGNYLTSAASLTFALRNGGGGSGRFIFSSPAKAGTTTSTQYLTQLIATYNPTSGTGLYTMLELTPTINQSGGANGITRGLHISPTLTSAADWRSIENTIGNNLLNSTSGNTYIGLSANNGTARLQVKGSGATSATTAFLVQNSTPTSIFTVLDNGLVGINRAPTSSLDVAGTTRLSGSFNTFTSGSILTVIGSGSTQPIFTVQGSQGELFSVTDSLSGSLFSVNDISGLPILEVFSDNTTLIGDYQDPMLITTKKVTMTNSGSFVVYSLPTASYDTAFFDYSIKSGSNARAGQIMAIQSGTSVNFTETTTTDFGSTTAVSFTVLVSGSNMVLTGSASTGSWTIKTIVRGI
jgi:hypothetical protein